MAVDMLNCPLYKLGRKSNVRRIRGLIGCILQITLKEADLECTAKSFLVGEL
jgi:hypothetical protein